MGNHLHAGAELQHRFEAVVLALAHQALGHAQRLRRLLEDILDANLIQADIEEETDAAAPGRPEVKRLSLIVRYIPA